MSTLAEALITARIAKGMSQEDLAALAGITQEAVSRYESDRHVPSDEVLERLAAAVGVTPSFLKDPHKIRGAWAVDAHMRRKASAKPTIWRRLEARLNMLRNHSQYLYEDVSIRAEHVVPTFDPFHVDPETAARMTRMQWRMPVGPVRSLTEWIESAGCLVLEEDFGTPRVDGLSQWVGDHPLMLLNSQVPTDRKRLTMAHELGHLCMHTLDVGEDMEAEANAFAEFLMPADVIRPQLRNVNLGQLIDLKRVWGVSIQALIERAAQLGTLNPQRRTALYKQLSARGWRRQEPASDELALEQPGLAQHIGAALFTRGLSPGEIAHIAGFSETAENNPFAPSERRLRVV